MEPDRVSIIAVVDVVLLTLKEGRLHVALFKRDNAPFAGTWALPGGFVHQQEDASVADTAERVLKQKTGIKRIWLEQLQVFSGPGRDPRGWSMTVAHYALVPLEVVEESSAGDMRLVDIAELRGLPFDHHEIIETAVARVRSKSTYSSIPAHLLPEKFTLGQLHATYEAVLAESINIGSFRRKIEEMDFLEEVPGETFQQGRMKPAQLYRLKKEYRQQLYLRSRGIAN